MKDWRFICRYNPADFHRVLHLLLRTLQVLDSAVKLDRLIMSRKGEVRESVGFCTLRKSAEEDYLQARRILEKLFGKKHGVAESFRDKFKHYDCLLTKTQEHIRYVALLKVVYNALCSTVHCGFAFIPKKVVLTMH